MLFLIKSCLSAVKTIADIRSSRVALAYSGQLYGELFQPGDIWRDYGLETFILMQGSHNQGLTHALPVLQALGADLNPVTYRLVSDKHTYK